MTECKEKRGTVKGLHLSLKSRNRTVVKKRIIQFRVPQSESRHVKQATKEKLRSDKFDDIIEEHRNMCGKPFLANAVSEAETKVKGMHLIKHLKNVSNKMEDPANQDS